MATAAELCQQANEKYVDEDFQRAVELYTEALGVDGTRDDVYCHRAQANIQLGKFAEAVEDCDKAVQLNENNTKAYLRKGTALLQLDETSKALEVFKEGQKRCDSDNAFDVWIKKCEDKLPTASSAPPLKPVSSIRHEWYQTHTHVVLTVFAKGVKKENLTVDVEDGTVQVSIRGYQDTDYDLSLLLAHSILSKESTVKLLSTKIEIKLKKTEGTQWSKLERSPDEVVKDMFVAAPVVEATTPKYPSSSVKSKDWDKLAQEVTEEEKNEKLEGDAGLNQFFQKLYGDASDETKKAMAKSFSESGGTVLSTNWSEVGAKKVDVKPPDGMEYRQWET